MHPTHSVWEGKTYDHPRQHSIAIMCDDVDATVDELRAKGARSVAQSRNASTVAQRNLYENAAFGLVMGDKRNANGWPV